MTKKEVLSLATEQNRVINVAPNKIEFEDGSVYAKNLISKDEYRKVKVFTL